MKLKTVVAGIFISAVLLFFLSGCATGQTGALEIDEKTGEIIEK